MICYYFNVQFQGQSAKHGTISVVESFSLPTVTSRAVPFKRSVSFASQQTVILCDGNRCCGIKLERVLRVTFVCVKLELNCPQQRRLDRVDTLFSLSSKLQVVFPHGNYLCPLFPDRRMSKNVSQPNVEIQEWLPRFFHFSPSHLRI